MYTNMQSKFTNFTTQRCQEQTGLTKTSIKYLPLGKQHSKLKKQVIIKLETAGAG